MAANFDLSKELETTPGRTNYARLCRLLIEGGTKALRQVFDTIHPPSRLASNLADPKTQSNLKSVLKRKIITQKQYDMLYPTPSSAVNSVNFDITLLMILLRNICKLKQPQDGWDKLPRPVDKSVGADIARIKFYRNKLCHGQTASVDDIHFHGFWDDVSDALVRLGAKKADVDWLKTDAMDRELEERYTNEVLDWAKADADSIELFKSILKAVTASEEEKLYCDDHNAHANLYCAHCREFICSACSIVKHQEERCFVTDTREVARRLRHRIGLNLPKLQEKIVEIRASLERAKEVAEMVKSDFLKKDKEITELEKDETEKAALKTRLNDQYEDIMKETIDGTSALRKQAENAEQIARYLKGLPQIDSDDKLMTEYKTAEMHIENISKFETSFQVSYQSEPDTFHLYHRNNPAASSVKPTRPPHEIRVNDQVSFDITVRDFKGGAVYGDSEDMKCDVKDPEKKKLTPSLENLTGDGKTHRITFPVEKHGEYEVSVRLRNQDVTGSPYTFKVGSAFQYKCSKYKSDSLTYSQMKYYAENPHTMGNDFFREKPSFLALDKEGKLIVVDGSGSLEVHRFNQSLVLENTIKVDAKCTFYCFRPKCIAVSPSGTYLFANESIPTFCKKHPIVECDMNGRRRNIIGEGHLESAFGIAMSDVTDKLYATEENKHRLHIFQYDSDSGQYTYVKAVGSLGRQPGQFRNPTFVTTNSSGDVVVSDSSNLRVQVLSAEGEFLFKIGGRGEELYNMQDPLGIAVDRDDNIYVCDKPNHRVQKFDKSGLFLACLLLRRDGFKWPLSIAVTKDTPFTIFLTDNETYAVKSYTCELNIQE